MHTVMRELALAIVAFAAFYNVLVVIVLSKWECDSANQLFHRLLKSSRDQDEAHHIFNSEANSIIFDIDALDDVSDEDVYWTELLKAVRGLNEMKKRVEFNASETIRVVTEATITSDIDAINTVYDHLADFEDPMRLGDAGSLAMRAQQKVDDYIEKAHTRYAEFINTVVPERRVIEDTLEKLTESNEGGPAKQDMEKATRDIQSITQRMEEGMNKHRDEFMDEIEKWAIDVEMEYQLVHQELVALLHRNLESEAFAMTDHWAKYHS